MAANCEYFVNGKWISESKFKELLFNGLLDQLIAQNYDKGFDIEGYKLDPNKLKITERTALGPIKLPLIRKINKRLNFAYKEDGTPEQFNPATIVEKANQEREKQNKKGFPIQREKIPFIITIKVGDQLQFGKLGKAVLESLEESPLFESMKEKLKEGQPYILIPSAYGWYPISLWSNKLKDTSYFKNLKPAISEIYKANSEEQVASVIKGVQSTLFKINIKKRKGNLVIQKKERNLESEKDEVVKTLEFSTENVSPEQQAADIAEIVEFLGEQLAQVDHTRINDKKGYNSKAADAGVITTNLFQENGDFFNSSSFMIMPYKPSAKASKLISEAAAKMNNVIEKTENTPKENIDEEVGNSIKEREEDKPNQGTKKDEHVAFNLTKEELATRTQIKIKLDNNTTVTLSAFRLKNGTHRIIEGSVRKQQKVKGKFTNVEPKFTNSQLKFITKEITKTLNEKFGQPDSETSSLDSIIGKETDKETEFGGAVTASKAAEAYGKSLIGEDLTKEEEELLGRVDEILSKKDIEEIEKIAQERLNQNKKDIEAKEVIPTKNAFEFSKEEKEALSKEELAAGLEFTEETSEVEIEDDPFDEFNTEEGEAYEDEDSDSDDLEPRARVTSNIDGSKWTEENGGLEEAKGYLGDKISNFLVAKDKGGRLITFKTIEDLKEYLPEEVYDMLIEARRQGKYLSGVFTKAALMLNEGALEGTEYHEAFHIVFNLALPLETRWKIINEASVKFRKELPKNATWVQIEEKLADKFMEYKLADEKVSESFGDTIDNFFKSLWRSIKLFFNPRATVSIDELFENIDLGIYKNRITFSNTDLSKIKAEDLRFKEDDVEYNINDPYIEGQALSYLRTLLFETLKDLQKNHFRNRSYPEIIKKIGIRALYTDLFQKVLNNYQANKKAKTSRTKLLQNLLFALANSDPKSKSLNPEFIDVRKNKQNGGLDIVGIKKLSPLMGKLSDYLRADGINMNLTSVEEVSRILEEDEASLQEDSENSTIEERWQRSFININPVDSLSFNLKIELGNFKKKNKNGSTKRTVFGSPETYSGKEVYNFLAMNITDSYTPEKMLEKLRALKGENEYVQELIDLITTDAELRKKLFIGLGALTKQDFTTVFEENGVYKVFYSNRKDLNQIIIQNILSQVLSNGNKLFNIYPKGHALEGQSDYENINKTTLKGLNTLLSKIREAVFVRKEGKLTQITKAITNQEAQSIFKNLSAAFEKLNIDLTPQDFDKIWNPIRTDIKADWKNITVIINTLTKITDTLNEGKNPFLFATPEDKLKTKEGKRFSNLKYGKTVIESLGKQVQLALNEEVVLAFRNAKGKSTYAVHLAAHLNKVFAKFKDKDELLKILKLKANDPIQKRIPFLQDLLDATGELSNAAEMLQVVVFDALARKGKKNKVGYMDLSDPEKIEVELAHFISNGFEKSDSFGFSILPTPSDATNIPFIRVEKHNAEEITDGLTEIALGEIERIRIIKKLDKNAAINRVANHNKRAKKFTDLPFLNGKINPDTILENPNYKQVIKDEITKYLEEEFFESQIKYYEKIGIIKPFNANVITEGRRKKLNKYGFSNSVINKSMSSDDIKSIDNINSYEEAQKLREKYSGNLVPARPLQFIEEISQQLKNAKISEKALTKLGINKSSRPEIKASEYFKSFLLNSFYNNYQLGLVLAGSSAFYSSPINQQKRFKQHVSPGNYTANTSGSYGMIIMEDNMIPSSNKLVNSIINTIINPSNLPESKKKELRAIWNNKVQGKKGDLHNETDGATFISVDAYLRRLDSMARLTQEHKDAAKRIKEGIDRVEDMALFPPLKPHVFTKIYTEEGFERPLQIKNAEFILTKRFANQVKPGTTELKYPKLAKAYEILNEGIKAEDGSVKKIDMIPFESAVKVGAIYDSIDADGNPAFASIQQNEEGDYYLKGNGTTIQIPAEDWKNQQETPPHYYDKDAEGNFGSQTRNHLIADTDLEEDYVENYDNPKRKKKRKGKELVEEYQDNIVYNIQEAYQDVESLFLDEEGNIDYDSLEALIEKEIRARNLGDSFLEAIRTLRVTTIDGKTISKPKVPYWNPNISYKIFSILHSVFKNNVTKQKIFGGQMINATSYGVSDDLEIIVDKETGGITYEALLPWDTKKYFPKDENGNVDIEFLQQNAPELLRVVGYRIPTEDKYSMFNIKIVGFTDVASGGTIILPPEVPFISGLDFDIDKLFMIKPRFYLETVDGKKIPKYIQPLTEDSSVPEIIDHIFRSNRLFKEFLEKYYRNGFKIGGVKYTVEQLTELRRNLLDEKKELEKDKQDTFRKLEAQLRRAKELKSVDSKLKQLKIDFAEKELEDYIAELEETSTPFDEDLLENHKDLKEVKDYLKRNFKKSKIENILELNGKEGRDNRILEITRTILHSRRSSESIVDVGNYERLREIGNKIKLLKAKSDDAIIVENEKTKSLNKETDKAISNYKKTGDILAYRNRLIELVELYEQASLDYYLPSTQHEFFRRNMTGAKLTGIFANHAASHSKAQFTGLEISEGAGIQFNGEVFTKLNQQTSTKGLAKGERISKSLSSDVAAVLDNASDPVSADIGMNTFNADIVALLQRVGIDDETIFMFLNQPIVLEFTNQYFRERPSSSKLPILGNKLKAKWQRLAISKNLVTAAEIKALEDENLNLNLEDLEKGLASDGSSEFYLLQFKVMNAFLTYYNIGKELSELVQSTRTDTTPIGPDLGSTYAMINRQERMLRKPNGVLLNKGDFLYENAGGNQKINKAFQKFGWLKPSALLNKIVPFLGEIDPVTGEIEYSQLGKIKNFFSNMKDEAFTMSDKEARDLDMHFMTYLASNFELFDRKHAKKTLEELPEKFKKFRREYLNTNLRPFLSQLHTVNPDSSYEVQRIEFYKHGKEGDDFERARKVWKNMLSKDIGDNFTAEQKAEIQKTAIELIQYTYFTNGFLYGPYNFDSLIPPYFWSREFAEQPGSENLGLLDKKRRTFNDVLEEALSTVSGETAGVKNALTSKHLNRFLVQYAQNTFVSSMIIPLSNPKAEKQTNFSDGRKLENMEENEVFVVGTNNLGFHNSGDSRESYDGFREASAQTNSQGKRGNYLVYGEKGKLSQGKEGTGFALTTTRASLKEGKFIFAGSLEQTTEGYEKLKQAFIEDFNALLDAAEANPNQTFVVSPKLFEFSDRGEKNVAKNLNKLDGVEGKSLIRTIYFDRIKQKKDFPDNLILKRFLDPRTMKGISIGSNGIVTLNKGLNRDLEIYDIFQKERVENKSSKPEINTNSKLVFPTFLKVYDEKSKKVILLKKLVEDDSGVVKYKQVPKLGISQFILEYDFNNDIEESLVKYKEPDDVDPGFDPETAGIPADFDPDFSTLKSKGESNKVNKGFKETLDESRDSDADLEIADTFTNEEFEDISLGKSVSWDKFKSSLKFVIDSGEFKDEDIKQIVRDFTRYSKEQWSFTAPQEQERIMKILDECSPF